MTQTPRKIYLNLSVGTETFRELLNGYEMTDEGLALQIRYALEQKVISDIYLQVGSKNIRRTAVTTNTADSISLKEILLEPRLHITVFRVEMTLKKDAQIVGVSFSDGTITQEVNVVTTPLKKHNKIKLKTHGLWLSTSLLQPLMNSIEKSKHDINYLSPVRHLYFRTQVLFFKCNISGQHYICSCYSDITEHISDHKRQEFPEYSVKEAICHLCTKRPSTLSYAAHSGTFGKHYSPYVRMLSTIKKIEYKDAEDRVRELLGVPKIGEGWIRETMLFQIVKALYPTYTVLREYSPEWLNRQRFDVYIAELRIALEYQGEQHFKAVEIFGGEEGFRKTKVRDREKRRLAKENGVAVIDIKYTDPITESNIRDKIDALAKH